MSRSWAVSTHGVPKKGRKPRAEDCQRKFTTRDLLRLVDEEDADRERFVYRATLEQLIQGINQNLGTHDHTDWELAKMVERAESVIADL